jgi:hypothetical protein
MRATARADAHARHSCLGLIFKLLPPAFYSRLIAHAETYMPASQSVID